MLKLVKPGRQLIFRKAFAVAILLLSGCAGGHGATPLLPQGNADQGALDRYRVEAAQRYANVDEAIDPSVSPSDRAALRAALAKVPPALRGNFVLHTRDGRTIEAQPNATRVRSAEVQPLVVAGADSGSFRRFTANMTGYSQIQTTFTSICGIAASLPQNTNYSGYLIVGGNTTNGSGTFDAGLQYSQVCDAWEPYYKAGSANPTNLGSLRFACGGSYTIGTVVLPQNQSASEILLSIVGVVGSSIQSFSYMDQSAFADAYNSTGTNFVWKRLVGLAETTYNASDGIFFGFPLAVTTPKEPDLAQPGIAFSSTLLYGSGNAIYLTTSNSTVVSNPNDSTKVITSPDEYYLTDNSNEYEGIWQHVAASI